MSTEKAEGATQNCGKCKTELICVKVVSTWNNQTSEKLQWQNVKGNKPHFKYAGEKDGKTQYSCNLPQPEDIVEQQIQEHQSQPQPEPVPKVNTQVKVAGPYDEAELITRWASERAYKIVMAEVYDFSKLTEREKNSLGQKQGNLTKILADTLLKLRELHGIKTNYGADAFE